MRSAQALAGALILAAFPVLMVTAVPARAQAGPQARLTDAQAEDLARAAMGSDDPKLQADTLKRLQNHHFKSSLAKERELVLFVQAQLEDRQGKTPQAAITFHKLEQFWPHSSYLAEGQVIMAEAAVDHKRWQEAESRLHKSLDADIPAEVQRRSQELLLWVLAEQDRAAEGLPIVEALKPLGTAKPSERGLVGIMEALCAAARKTEAESTLKDYLHLFPDGPRAARMNLDWAKLLGSTGDAPGAARGFQALIRQDPAAPEADEARLALATLLTDGKLQPRQIPGLPSAQSLLADLQKASLKDGPAREMLLVKIRLALQESRWQDAIQAVGQYRALHPTTAEAQVVADHRATAMRSWAQQLLDQKRPAAILPYLDGEGIRCLTAPQRLGLARNLALGGLPEASQAIARVAPATEQADLLKASLDGTPSGANPRGALELLPGHRETPRESLARAQADLALHDWAGARAALAGAAPGPERIRALLAYLDRPAAKDEAPGARLKEAEAWLARAPEQGAVREPLTILAADLKTRSGDWRGALALYPAAPQPANRGWVILMRATCQARLGQPAPAKATLLLAKDDPSFKSERQALGEQLGL